jgi:hypothetical protein
MRTIGFTIFFTKIALISPVFGQAKWMPVPSPADTLMKLAIFTPHTKVYDAPWGKQIGIIDRGRVIRLISSEGVWFQFTTKDFPLAWVHWANTQTLQEWAASPRYDSAQAVIIAWEKAVRMLDEEIDSCLNNIIQFRDKIYSGEINPAKGAINIERERAAIEESFRQLYKIERLELLEEAMKVLERKRWAINRGIYFLNKFIYEGDSDSGKSAGEYFDMAQETMYDYSKIMYKLKTKYKLYENLNR